VPPSVIPAKETPGIEFAVAVALLYLMHGSETTDSRSYNTLRFLKGMVEQYED
jgi:hypothetical protein